MTVVRELVTKLKFNVEKKGIDNFSRAITGIRSKMLLVTAAVGGFVAGFVKSTSAIANTILDVDDLARTTGLTTEKLVAMSKAASNFRITDEQFARAMTTLNDHIQDAEQGYGELQKMAQEAGISIKDSSGNFLPVEDMFKLWIKYLGTIEDEQKRIAIAKNIFGTGVGFSDLAKEGVESFDELIEKNKELAQVFIDNKENARIFNQELNKMYQSFQNLIHKAFAPAIRGLTKFFEISNKMIDNTKKDGFLSAVFEQTKDEINDLGNFLGFSENLVGNINPFKSSSDSNNFVPQNNYDVNTTVNMTVPAGTPEQQQQFLQDSAREVFNESFNDNFENILPDFPERE